MAEDDVVLGEPENVTAEWAESMSIDSEVDSGLELGDAADTTTESVVLVEKARCMFVAVRGYAL